MQKFLTLLLFSCSSLCASLNVTHTGSSYDHSASGVCGDLFVAKTTPVAGSEEYSVSRVTTPVSDVTGLEELIIKPLIPLTTQVNGQVEVLETGTEKQYVAKKTDNPLHNKNIYDFSVYGDLPVVVTGATASTARTVTLIADPAEGSKVITTSDVRDAAGNLTTTIKKAVGGARIIPPARIGDRAQQFPVVFAAVTPSTGEGSDAFAGQDEAGIAVLHSKSNGLEAIDATGARGTAKAAVLNDALIKIGSTGTITGINAMYWDSTLQRLYIALALNSGGVAVVMGSLSVAMVVTGETMQGDKKVQTYGYDAKLTLRPVVAKADGTNDDTNWTTTADLIVGAKNSGITIQHLGMMHASTQRSYLVVARHDNEVYSVPVVREASASASSTQVGALAEINDTTYATAAVDGNTGQLYADEVSSTWVGGGVAPATIQSMAVYGDSVFISCAGDDANDKGVFVSTPLFNKDSIVTRWSAWQKVFGGVHKSYGFSVDNLARVNTVTGAADDARDTIRVANWGAAAGNDWWGGTAAAPSDSPIADINAFFQTSLGGISAVRMCNSSAVSNASWYDTTPWLTNSALACAVGRNKCALFFTQVSSAAITSANYVKASHFASFDLTDDSVDLGMLSCAAVTRRDTLLTGKGRLFVGGVKGLAVLCKTDGQGWASSLSDLGDLSTYRFKELTKADGSSFDCVRSIECGEESFYVIDANGLYKIAYDSDKFKDTSPDALGETLIATPATLLGSSDHAFLDLLIINEHAFLATTAGLWTQQDATLHEAVNQLGDGGWQEVFVKDTDSFGVCSHLSFVPALAEGNGGMLYVLTADVSLNVATVYRVAVVSSDIPAVIDDTQAIKHGVATTWHYTTMLGQLREYFYTDGAYAIDAGSHHHTDTNGTALVRVLPVSSSLNTIDRWVYSLAPDLGVRPPNHTVSGIVRDPATGTIMIPGLWGLRVLQ